ncbi:alkaline phosphatase [Natranaerovirga pectinivora]|nr:alkaline phosphatase [Natranaerovirga pectinivora]
MLKRNKKLISAITSFVMVLAIVLTTSSNVFAFFNSSKAATPVFQGKAPKYVFLFIGDGMSYPQIASTEMYLGKQGRLNDLVKGGGIEQLNFSKFPVSGAAQTFDATSFIPDSASTATSIASGYKTLSGVINMDISKQIEYTPISESLATKGYKVGIVSSVPINHATPASFYSKVPHRNEYYNIALQLADSGFDYFGGGGFLSPQGNGQTHIYEVLEEKGYNLALDKASILNLNNKSGKVVAINPDMSVDGTSLPYEVDRKQGELALADFVRKGIDVLDNPKGFFMMVEGGKIDWANHANDAVASIHDTIAFSNAVEEAIRFYNKHPEDTLIIVTGDHETGGMSIGFAGTGYSTFFDKLDRANTSANDIFRREVLNPYKEKHTMETAKLSDLALDIKYSFGVLIPNDPEARFYPEMVLNANEIQRLEAALKQSMTPSNQRNYSQQERLMYGGYEPLSITLTHILNNKAGITFGTYDHTGLPVPVFALGKGQELFTGFYDNTDIYRKMAAILNVR